MSAAWKLDQWLGTRVRAPAPGADWVATPFGHFHVRRSGGQGPSLVFANDAPNVLAHYDGLFEALGPGVRATAFELLGSGRSRQEGGGRFDHSFQAQRDSIARLLEALGGGPHVLVFPCVTGLLAHAVARARPDLVRAVVLSQTPVWRELDRWVERADPRRLLRRPWLGQALVALGRRRIVEGWYRVAVADPEQARRFARVALAPERRGEQYALASMFQQWASADRAMPPLEGLPALVVWGDADRTHRKTDRRATLELAPHARYVELPGVGHSPELEQPARFTEVLTGWLRDSVLPVKTGP